MPRRLQRLNLKRMLNNQRFIDNNDFLTAETRLCKLPVLSFIQSHLPRSPPTKIKTPRNSSQPVASYNNLFCHSKCHKPHLLCMEVSNLCCVSGPVRRREDQRARRGRLARGATSHVSGHLIQGSRSQLLVLQLHLEEW